DEGYVSIHAYLDRHEQAGFAALREAIAERVQRPVTFGWAPRFLHSTGQFHKGGPAVGVFLQLTSAGQADVPVPGRDFSFGELIRARAAGDASVLSGHGHPVLSPELSVPDTALQRIPGVIRRL